VKNIKEQRIKEGQDYDIIIQKSRPDPTILDHDCDCGVPFPDFPADTAIEIL